MNQPLSDYFRPKKIEDLVGQPHLTGKDKILYRAIKNKMIPNMIFYGPPGVGKTTAANIISHTSEKSMHMLNATYTKTDQIKDILKDAKRGSLDKSDIIYIDEIQNFNKKQQQVLLEYIEKGDIVLIASTTENPYHYVYKALLSRCLVLEFKNLDSDSIVENIKKIIERLKSDGQKIEYDIQAIERIAIYAEGDMRRAINLLELIVQLYNNEDNIKIDKELISNIGLSKQLSYDISGDNHYDILSAFQKSIRGSDADAALHYLARLIKSDDLKSICRRLLVIASEDIGLAYPQAVTIVKSCVDSALMLGFPEAKIPLSQAVILLSMSPKSNSSISSIENALKDLEDKNIGDIPIHLKDAHYSGAEKMGRGTEYKYPHSYKNNYIDQQYLPSEIKDSKYYHAGNNKFESGLKSYIEAIKKI